MSVTQIGERKAGDAARARRVVVDESWPIALWVARRNQIGGHHDHLFGAGCAYAEEGDRLRRRRRRRHLHQNQPEDVLFIEELHVQRVRAVGGGVDVDKVLA